MDTYQAQQLALDLIAEHGLDGWTFRFDGAKNRFGICRYGRREIGLSRPLTALNGYDEVRDTILHEIAHALTPGAGHGPRWKQMAARIGAKPDRCYDGATVNRPQAAWTGHCHNCDFTVDRHRLTETAKRGACPKCCKRYNGGRFTEQYRLTWKRNSGA